MRIRVTATVPRVLPCPASAIATAGGSINLALECRNPSSVILPGTSWICLKWTSPEDIHFISPPQKAGTRVLGVPPTKTSASVLSNDSGHGCAKGGLSLIFIFQLFDDFLHLACKRVTLRFQFMKVYSVFIPPILKSLDDPPCPRIQILIHLFSGDITELTQN